MWQYVEVWVCIFISHVCCQYCQDPRTESDCISNIREFLRGCSSLKVEVSSSVYSNFDVEVLLGYDMA